jgi:hypothetical protein
MEISYIYLFIWRKRIFVVFCSGGYVADNTDS